MATDKKAGAKAPAKPKKVYVTVKGEDNKSKKFELLGGPTKKFIFQGESYTKENAAKNPELIASLLATGSPLLEEIV